MTRLMNLAARRGARLAFVALLLTLVFPRAAFSQQITCPVATDLTNSLVATNALPCMIESGVTLTNNAVFMNNAGATLTNSGGASIVNNQMFTNSGTLDNSSDATITNNSGATLINDIDPINNSGTITNGGSLDNGAMFENNIGGTVLNKSGATLTNTGLFHNNLAATLTDGGTITNNTAFSNEGGIVNIQAGGTFSNSSGSSYMQTAGGRTTVNGTLNSAPTVQLQSGALLGAGTINGDVNNSAANVQPGSAFGTPGTLTINGDYTQPFDGTGTLTIDLGGTAPGDYGVLDVTGLATLYGQWDFTAVNGFTPTTGDEFTFLLDGSLVGGINLDFTNWSCPTGDLCTVGVGQHSLTLDITGPTSGGGTVPEPSSFALLAAAILALGIVQRRRFSLTH